MEGNALKSEKPIYLLLGPYTAIGGVSVHIKRLAEILDEDYLFKFIDESPQKTPGVFHLRSGNILAYLKLLKNAQVVHIHTGIWWLRCIHIAIAFLLKKKILVTIHSLSNLNKRYKISITNVLLRLTTITIAVSERISDAIKVKKKIVLNAFIPPIIENETELPDEVVQLLHHNANKKTIVANAFKLVLYNGEDLYGLDLMIEVAKLAKKHQNDYKIIFVVASKDDENKMLKNYLEAISSYGLQQYITVLNYPISFAWLIKRSDLVVRPTNTDGDALTIREALFLKTPVIASNVVARPEGTFLFQNRDVPSLYSAIENVLNQDRKTASNQNTQETIATLRRKYISIIETE
ncbi:glycosyltransferase [Allomuricauda sp. d1]|uniref:glycosyltransferase n=1 Tax=Allomuricauda sp. d1 TaxID=3136725 RepID=UPI0031E01E1F